MLNLGGVAEAIAKYYGYKTLGGLASENFGLIVVLAAFIVVGFVFYKLMDRQFPRGSREPFKAWIFKAVIVFFMAAFVFICGFTLFYEKKKADQHSSADQPGKEYFYQS